jgi:hypothetical protein
MLEVSISSSTAKRTLLDRVRDAVVAHACAEVWVRGSGLHILLGRGPGDAFARVTALGGGAYGLAFRGTMGNAWEPLLVDDLRAVVEHALIGEDQI